MTDHAIGVAQFPVLRTVYINKGTERKENKMHKIVKILNGWGSLRAEDWDLILGKLSKGEEISVWNGLFRDRPAKEMEGKMLIASEKREKEEVGSWENQIEI